MPVIGTFAAVRDGYAGHIRTLTINSRVRIIANDRREKDGAPDFRVIASEAEIGVAWRVVKSNSDSSYLRVRLDDPALPRPIWAALLELPAGGIIRLVWWRNKREAV
ncbi:MAG TPA: DUF736 family protein [Hyphomicrobiales bacterium]|jgi:uncharacterized protein (DUF736 family)